MSRLYNLIENSVVNVAKLVINNQTDQEQINWMLQNAGVFVAVTTAILFVVVIFIAGKFLWNQGLAPVFNFIRPLGYEAPLPQYQNPYMQLVVSLVSLMMIL